MGGARGAVERDNRRGATRITSQDRREDRRDERAEVDAEIEDGEVAVEEDLLNDGETRSWASAGSPIADNRPCVTGSGHRRVDRRTPSRRRYRTRSAAD